MEPSVTGKGAYLAQCDMLWNETESRLRETEPVRKFWRVWTNLHGQLLQELGDHFDGGASPQRGTSTRDPEALCQETLKTRLRMVSALSQALHRIPEGALARPSCSRLLARHDEDFCVRLEQVLARLKSQLAQAHTTRKTLTAYAKTFHFRETP